MRAKVPNTLVHHLLFLLLPTSGLQPEYMISLHITSDTAKLNLRPKSKSRRLYTKETVYED